MKMKSGLLIISVLDCYATDSISGALDAYNGVVVGKELHREDALFCSKKCLRT